MWAAPVGHHKKGRISTLRIWLELAVASSMSCARETRQGGRLDNFAHGSFAAVADLRAMLASGSCRPEADIAADRPAIPTANSLLRAAPGS